MRWTIGPDREASGNQSAGPEDVTDRELSSPGVCPGAGSLSRAPGVIYHVGQEGD